MRWFSLLFFLATTQCTTPEKTSAKKESTAVKVDRTEIKKTIHSHRKYLSHCYGKILTRKGKEKLKGRVFVNFKIGPDGKAFEPKMVKERSTIQDPQLNKCLFAGLTSWDFPVHAEGEIIEVKYPFRFHGGPPADMQKKMDKFEKLRPR